MNTPDALHDTPTESPNATPRFSVHLFDFYEYPNGDLAADVSITFPAIGSVRINNVRLADSPLGPELKWPCKPTASGPRAVATCSAAIRTAIAAALCEEAARRGLPFSPVVAHPGAA